MAGNSTPFQSPKHKRNDWYLSAIFNDDGSAWAKIFEEGDSMRKHNEGRENIIYKSFDSKDDAQELREFIETAAKMVQLNQAMITDPATCFHPLVLGQSHLPPRLAPGNEQMFQKALVIYTDGSHEKDGSAGYGVFSNKQNLDLEIPGKIEGDKKHVTAPRSELYAYKIAIEEAIKKGAEAVEIRTDCFNDVKFIDWYADKWMQNGWKDCEDGRVCNRDLIDWIRKACDQLWVRFI